MLNCYDFTMAVELEQLLHLRRARRSLRDKAILKEAVHREGGAQRTSRGRSLIIQSSS